MILYIQAVGYFWCSALFAFLFCFIMSAIISDIGKEPVSKLLFVTIALSLPLLFAAFHFGIIAAILIFW